jgi:DNA-binding IclR family transcriptional regulator
MPKAVTNRRNSKKTAGKEDSFEYIVPAVDRAARILALLKAEARGMTIAEIAEASGWHKSSVHKILVTLNHHKLLDRNEATKQYSLGIALIGYGQYVLNNLDIAYAAKSFLKELADSTGETANYSLVRGTQIVLVDSVESRTDLRVVPPVGTINPITIKSSGTAILAHLPEAEAEKIIQAEGLPAFTKNSITDLPALRRELAAIRKRGYATDVEEFRNGISAISAPVFNPSGAAIGTLSLVGPASRMTKDKLAEYGKMLIDAAGQLSAMMPR